MPKVGPESGFLAFLSLSQDWEQADHVRNLTMQVGRNYALHIIMEKYNKFYLYLSKYYIENLYLPVWDTQVRFKYMASFDP